MRNKRTSRHRILSLQNIYVCPSVCFSAVDILTVIEYASINNLFSSLIIRKYEWWLMTVASKANSSFGRAEMLKRPRSDQSHRRRRDRSTRTRHRTRWTSLLYFSPLLSVDAVFVLLPACVKYHRHLNFSTRRRSVDIALEFRLSQISIDASQEAVYGYRTSHWIREEWAAFGQGEDHRPSRSVWPTSWRPWRGRKSSVWTSWSWTTGR